MRKKLDTRFPAARIKKIMQADEDVGKIAMAVPVLVSKALELFLQDLCDRTYDITLQRGAKTVSSLHLNFSSESNVVGTVTGVLRCTGSSVIAYECNREECLEQYEEGIHLFLHGSQELHAPL